jgi:hypothetical protein
VDIVVPVDRRLDQEGPKPFSTHFGLVSSAGGWGQLTKPYIAPYSTYETSYALLAIRKLHCNTAGWKLCAKEKSLLSGLCSSAHRYLVTCCAGKVIGYDR